MCSSLAKCHPLRWDLLTKNGGDRMQQQRTAFPKKSFVRFSIYCSLLRTNSIRMSLNFSATGKRRDESSSSSFALSYMDNAAKSSLIRKICAGLSSLIAMIAYSCTGALQSGASYLGLFIRFETSCAAIKSDGNGLSSDCTLSNGLAEQSSHRASSSRCRITGIRL